MSKVRRETNSWEKYNNDEIIGKKISNIDGRGINYKINKNCPEYCKKIYTIHCEKNIGKPKRT